MSVDKLQERIRKKKNPTVVDLTILPEQIPPEILQEQGSYCKAYFAYAEALLNALKEFVPAVKFDFSGFALLGTEGLDVLARILKIAKDCGFYVLLYGIELLSAHSAQRAADLLLSKDCSWQFDGLIINGFIGSDGIRPFADCLKTSEKSLFVAVRTANKSAAEVQDLLSGSRLVHIAKTDIINRFADATLGKCGYAQVAVMASATSADSLRTLRSKYKYLFLLVDGCDYPNGNAKNCSFAFDSLGHGAIVCAGASVTAAWQEDSQADYLSAAVEAAMRLKKNLNRYITIL